MRSLVIMELSIMTKYKLKNVGTKDMVPTFLISEFVMNGQFK